MRSIRGAGFAVLILLPVQGFGFSPDCAELHEKPDLRSKVIGEVCRDLGKDGDTLPFDQSKVVQGGKYGLVEVLQPTRLVDIELKKGARFRFEDGEGEGMCTVHVDGHPKALANCVWLGGFANQERDTYRMTGAPGGQNWYRVVNADGKVRGWYLHGYDTLLLTPKKVSGSKR
ncbi:MAG TPA: hypothetical protein VM598_08905 [Bdellovibrionota bacterium]|nr:hypothetical protein [Bdellovibrionota bacterium]